MADNHPRPGRRLVARSAAPRRDVDPAAMAAFDLGLHAYVAGDDAAACEHLARAVAADAAFAEAFYMLGLARQRLGDGEAARAALERAAAAAGDPALRAAAVQRLGRR